MCRYAFKTYKPHFVCFACRKTFKQPLLEDRILQNGDMDNYRKAFLNYDSPESKQFRNDNPVLINQFEKAYRNKEYKCPDCSAKMHNIGLDFKAPKKTKTKEWEVVRSMYFLGNTFHTCGCSGQGYIPKNKRDHLANLTEIHQGYRRKLEERDQKMDSKSLNEYLEYWSARLKLIELEINRLTVQL